MAAADGLDKRLDKIWTSFWTKRLDRLVQPLLRMAPALWWTGF